MLLIIQGNHAASCVTTRANLTRVLGNFRLGVESNTTITNTRQDKSLHTEHNRFFQYLLFII